MKKAVKIYYVTSTNTDDLQNKVHEILKVYRGNDVTFLPKLLPLVIAPKGLIQPIAIYE